jgi:hypothetical protein
MFKPSEMSCATSDITMESVAEESSSSDSLIDEEEKHMNHDDADLIDIDVIGISPQEIK